MPVLVGETKPSYDPVDDFPVGLFKNKEDYEAILANLREIKEHRREHNTDIPEEYDDEKAIKKTKLNRIFAIFIDNLSVKVHPTYTREISLLISLYQRCLNEIGGHKNEMLV